MTPVQNLQLHFERELRKRVRVRRAVFAISIGVVIMNLIACVHGNAAGAFGVVLWTVMALRQHEKVKSEERELEKYKSNVDVKCPPAIVRKP